MQFIFKLCDAFKLNLLGLQNFMLRSTLGNMWTFHVLLQLPFRVYLGNEFGIYYSSTCATEQNYSDSDSKPDNNDIRVISKSHH